MAANDKPYSPVYKGRITGKLYFEEQIKLSTSEASTKMIRSLDQPEVYSILRETEYIGQSFTEICDLVGVNLRVKPSKQTKEEELPGLPRSSSNTSTRKKAVKK
jgi:hypothetical protein